MDSRTTRMGRHPRSLRRTFHHDRMNASRMPVDQKRSNKCAFAHLLLSFTCKKWVDEIAGVRGQWFSFPKPKTEKWENLAMAVAVAANKPALDISPHVFRRIDLHLNNCIPPREIRKIILWYAVPTEKEAHLVAMARLLI